MSYDLNEICSKFNINTQISNYGNGHINDTYLCEGSPKLILQRINNKIFKNPFEVMENIYNVTTHLRKKIDAAGGDPLRETISVILTRDGQRFYKADEDNFFRMYTFVDNTVTYEVVENPIQLYHAGKAFGKFQRRLDDFPAKKLYETIKDFHNTPDRVEQLKSAIENNSANRKDQVKEEIQFALDYAKYASIIMDNIKSGLVPLRVTHNDTKINNLLFDVVTNEAICVIDLDTVMPGSALYDYGDALRFGASSGAEDEQDLDKIWFDMEKFEAFTKGFLEEIGDCLTEKEIELLPVSALILTYECGIRFLADHLNGDTYFKIHRENHNLDRARTQFKLCRDIESKFPEMKKIVDKYL